MLHFLDPQDAERECPSRRHRKRTYKDRTAQRAYDGIQSARVDGEQAPGASGEGAFWRGYRGVPGLITPGGMALVDICYRAGQDRRRSDDCPGCHGTGRIGGDGPRVEAHCVTAEEADQQWPVGWYCGLIEGSVPDGDWQLCCRSQQVGPCDNEQDALNRLRNGVARLAAREAHRAR